MTGVWNRPWWIFVGAACTGSASGNPERLAEICRATTNMGDAICTCVGDRARTQLSSKGLAFLVASMNKQEEAAERLKQELTMQELTTAGMFFVTAPAACAAQAKGGA